MRLYYCYYCIDTSINSVDIGTFLLLSGLPRTDQMNFNTSQLTEGLLSLPVIINCKTSLAITLYSYWLQPKLLKQLFSLYDLYMGLASLESALKCTSFECAQLHIRNILNQKI